MTRTWIRRMHRWVSIAFTAISAAIFIMLAAGLQPVQWVYYLPLVPLAILVISGLQMFVAPYIAGRRPRQLDGRAVAQS